MRVAALIKQIPKGEEMTIVDGRLNRAGVELEVNAYCRRANAQAVALAGDDGEVVVFSMGPPSAEDALREMIACGATRGVHLCDIEFAGSDTLATAKALALAIVKEGPFDLIMCGLNSLDADTGQVGPEVAELLGVPFVAGARELRMDGRTALIRAETDDGWQDVRLRLPAVVSAAERLVDPSKADPSRRAAVDPSAITRRTARSLGLRADETGLAGSPTRVGTPRVLSIARTPIVAADADHAVRILHDIGALDDTDSVVGPAVAEHNGTGAHVWCFLDPDPEHPRHELLGEAARLAAEIGGTVTALLPGRRPDLSAAATWSSQGADRIMMVPGSHAETWATAIAEAVSAGRPRVLLIEGTQSGRAIASKVAARHGWGLTGDGIEVEIDHDGALTVWKPALGGRLVVPITSSSTVQIATIRPGVVALRTPRPARAIEVTSLLGGRSPASSVEVLATERSDSGRRELAGARTVVGVGQGVRPEHYGELDDLLRELGGAQLAATRKVTDKGWMPRSRQVGVTGLSISPHLYVSIGASGRFNHSSGFQASRFVLALNEDPHAEIFQQADVGLVGSWRESVPLLVAALARVHNRSATQSNHTHAHQHARQPGREPTLEHTS